MCVVCCVLSPPSAGPPLFRTALRWTAQNFALFSPLPPQNSFFSFLSGGLLVEFWWCLKRRDPQMCTFGVLGLSCENFRTTVLTPATRRLADLPSQRNAPVTAERQREGFGSGASHDDAPSHQPRSLLSSLEREGSPRALWPGVARNPPSSNFAREDNKTGSPNWPDNSG